MNTVCMVVVITVRTQARSEKKPGYEAMVVKEAVLYWSKQACGRRRILQGQEVAFCTDPSPRSYCLSSQLGRLGASCGAMSVVARDFMEGSMVSVSCKQLCVSLRTQPDSRIKAGTP